MADAHALPLADASVDLIWSNLALHWFAAPERAVGEWYRVARPGGLAHFSFFGVDTLAELRALGARMMAFHDLHDIGDLLAAAGFADPVMDSERLTLTWAGPQALLGDLHALGGNALRGRFRGLLGRGHRPAGCTRSKRCAAPTGACRRRSNWCSVTPGVRRASAVPTVCLRSSSRRGACPAPRPEAREEFLPFAGIFWRPYNRLP